jgi:hypothetical protein
MRRSVSVQVRVNGVVIRHVRLRGPENSPELVIVDPVIGAFAVDDRDQRFKIEVLDLDIPVAARANLPNGGWRDVSARALITILNPVSVDTDGDGDRCSWVHGSDMAEIRGFRATARPTDLDARLGLKKAARTLYAAGIPYLAVGGYHPSEEAVGCTHTVLIIVRDAPRAHQCLCFDGFEAHPTSVNSVISREYNFEVRLVPDGKPKRTRK